MFAAVAKSIFGSANDRYVRGLGKYVDAAVMICENFCVAFADVADVDTVQQPLQATGLARFDLFDQFRGGFLAFSFEVCDVFGLERIQIRDIVYHPLVDQSLDQNLAQAFNIHRFA